MGCVSSSRAVGGSNGQGALGLTAVCRENEISDATYYLWKSKYGGVQASDIKRLRELEEEDRRLKQISADLLLENRARKDVTQEGFEASREA